jgi:hopanoid biosynthesis associated radical SAM protein HpnH
MRFPLALTLKIAGHITKQRLKRNPRFAMVLQLEPLHTCNLTCTGCGRIREYSTSLKDMVPIEKCLEAASDCDAPMVSICGGEPLIYPKIEELVAGLTDQGRIIYICTNGMFMRKKMRDYLTVHYSPEMESKLQQLVTEQLVTEKEAEAIRSADAAARQKVVIVPSQWMYWNVHLDGLEYTHDLIVEREGVFKECIAAIRMAKILGYQVATNTTIYKETDMAEIEQMFRYLSFLDVDGHTISPGYDYDAAKKDMVKRLGKDPKDFFLTRDLTREKFKNIEEWGKLFTLFGTPVYHRFLAGKQDLTCSAWAIPTFNVKGWKAPCYVMTDEKLGHFDRYQTMLDSVKWDDYGVVQGVARDPRCENCMMHCGYEPSGALSSRPLDTWLNLKFNFSARPKRVVEGGTVQAFNGFSMGKGHLAEAKSTVNKALAGARSVYQRNGDHDHAPSTVSTGPTQREELLAKLRDNARIEVKPE